MYNKWNVDEFLGNSWGAPYQMEFIPFFGSVYFEDFENLTGYLH
jgi:hypothetical protein